MIKRLRKRFIRIATLAVTGVMLVLCIALNTANFLSVRAEQQRMLDMICDNQGTLPSAPPRRRPAARRRPRRRLLHARDTLLHALFCPALQ